MDLKSKNVLLNGRKDLAKIADVGLSRIIQSTLGGQSSTPFGVGTFEYTAPEILLGRQCNEKARDQAARCLAAFWPCLLAQNIQAALCLAAFWPYLLAQNYIQQTVGNGFMSCTATERRCSNVYASKAHSCHQRQSIVMSH